ncbi:MAG: dTMP kinase [Candidatus Shapirobacteria bacterium]
MDIKMGKHPFPGLYVAFEGIGGCGKTTQLMRLKKELGASCSERVLWFREPGGTEFSEGIRKLILDAESPECSVLTELFAFATARSDTLEKIVRPALQKGERGLMTTDLI